MHKIRMKHSDNIKNKEQSLIDRNKPFVWAVGHNGSCCGTFWFFTTHKKAKSFADKKNEDYKYATFKIYHYVKIIELDKE